MPFWASRGPRRWIAVAVGFFGVLIIIRPGLGVIQPASSWRLAPPLYALYQVLTRMVGRSTPPRPACSGSSWSARRVLELRGPVRLEHAGARHWPLFVLVAALGGVGHYSMIRALHLAPAAVIQPFSYTLLLWAVVIGYLGFGDLPDLPTLAGAGVIVGAGGYAALGSRSSPAS